MPKAKPTPAEVTKVAKVITKKASKTEIAKNAPVQDSSKTIKKAPKVSAVPASSPKSKRPSAPPKKPSNAYIFFNLEMQTQMKGMEKFKNMPF